MNEALLAPVFLQALSVLFLGSAIGLMVGAVVGYPGLTAPRPWVGARAPHGAQGLLGENGAVRRLELAVGDQDRTHPVTIVLLDVTIADRALPPPGRAAAHRAVARVVEHRAGEDQVPFALAHHRMGVLLPDATTGRVWDVVDGILADLVTARFTHGEARTSRPLGPAIEVHVGVCRQSDPRSSARALLSHAIDAAEHAGEQHAAERRHATHALLGRPAGGAWLQSDGAELP